MTIAMNCRFEEDILDWATVRLDFRSSEIEAEILEVSMSKPAYCTVRTRGKSPLKEGDTVHVDTLTFGGRRKIEEPTLSNIHPI
jgi:hypothetical protein